MAVFNIPYISTNLGKKEVFHSKDLNRAYTSSISGTISTIEDSFVLGDEIFDLIHYFNSDGSYKGGYVDGQTIISFPSGTYLTIHRYVETSQILARVYFHYPNTSATGVFSCAIWTQSGGFIEHGIFLCINFANDDTTYSNPRFNTWGIQGRDNYFWFPANSNNDTILDPNFLRDNIPPEYTWHSWNYINGNNGQYRCLLPLIKDSSIGDFSGTVTGDADDFSRISDQADIWGIFQNMSYGEERTIAWSGNAYMTLKITAESQMPSYANFIFKFYSNQDTLLVTRAELVRWNGTGADVVIRLYLSFAYDEDEQAALFCPVIKMIDGTTYKWGYLNQYDDTEMLNMWQWLHMSTAGEDDRPYDTGTTDNGGNPEGDILTNDDVTNVNVPTLSALQTGMLTVYVPDDTELQHIASYLWSDNVIDNFKKYFNNFSDNIISLYVLPYKPSNLPNKPFKVGGLESSDLELASVDYITNRFVDIDMGEVDVGGLWNSYLDFSPYTKFNVYLPGIGVQAIDADDIMAPLDKNKNFGSKPGSKLKLDYVMDLMTGILVAYIKVNGQIRYQFSGKIGYQIPITGENYNNIVHAFTVAASGFVTTLASGGQTAPFALGAVAAAAINFNKPDVYRGGNLSGSASSMSYKHPYLIRRVPNKPQLVNQDKFTGFPTYKSGKLRDFGGYTEVVEVHAEGFVCTEEEREEIIELLKKGVIL